MNTNKNPSVKINPNVKTAIIYSLDDLFAYTVEIKEADRSYYIADGQDPISFGNMKDAREAAIKEGAIEAYLALSKTYDKTGINNLDQTHQERFDYSPIKLDNVDE
ncbi:hypothetical protein ACQUW5_06085 [Legionella sp. CNM-1927-20]|uniref:hypothetical protein n=1 Tax=Legionella sp. CNM-1927-20 TaxID=3422221 RepID=UPI00403B0EC5